MGSRERPTTEPGDGRKGNEMSKKFGIYSNDMATSGAMLAFGDSPDDCRMQVIQACGDDAADDCEIVEVTDALADTDGGSWAWLPGSNETIACLRAETETSQGSCNCGGDCPCEIRQTHDGAARQRAKALVMAIN